MQNQTVLFIGHLWPEPATTAAGHHMLQLLQAFLDLGYHVTFATTAAKTGYSEDLQAMGIATQSIKLNHASFDDFVKHLQPYVVVFDRFMVEEQFGWRVTEYAPQALRILNTEDVHSLRQVRETCIRKTIPFTIDRWKANDNTKREIASIYRSDLTLLVSSYETEVLQTEFQIANDLLLHVPFLLEPITTDRQASWPSFEARNNFVCFGNGKHAPNVDSINYLLKDIWPLIRKALPEANLNIYGAYLPQQINEKHNIKKGVFVHGWVDDLATVLQDARINLAPLRFGAGIKGKLIDAICNGTPSVTTPIGAEGMHDGLPWAGVITDDAEAFARKAIALYQDHKAWITAQKQGMTIVNTLYDKKGLEERLFQKITTLQSDLATHRNNNFMGALLQHQTMAATKYMGKWIEGKSDRR